MHRMPCPARERIRVLMHACARVRVGVHTYASVPAYGTRCGLPLLPFVLPTACACLRLPIPSHSGAVFVIRSIRRAPVAYSLLLVLGRTPVNSLFIAVS